MQGAVARRSSARSAKRTSHARYPLPHATTRESRSATARRGSGFAKAKHQPAGAINELYRPIGSRNTTGPASSAGPVRRSHQTLARPGLDLGLFGGRGGHGLEELVNHLAQVAGGHSAHLGVDQLAVGHEQ